MASGFSPITMIKCYSLSLSFSRESNIYGSICGLKRSKKLHCPGSPIHVRLWEQLLHVKDSALFCHLIREQFKPNNCIVIVVSYVSNTLYRRKKKLIHIVEYIVSTRYHVDGVLVVSSYSLYGVKYEVATRESICHGLYFNY